MMIAKSDYEFWGHSKISYEDVLSIKTKCKNTAITGEEFLYIVGNKNSLTDIGKDNLNALYIVAETYLVDFEKKYGLNIIEYFTKNFDYKNMKESDFNILREIIIDNDDKIYKNRNYKTKQEWFEALKNNHYNNIKYHIKTKKLFSRVPNISKSINFTYTFIPQIIQEALKNYLQRILREIENLYREEKGYPKIGEGWIRETELYTKLSDLFPNLKIMHHASPNWLGRQHLDIYIPEKNIGIEYQGLQHVQPIDFFGGEDAFCKQKKYDQSKLNKCKENNCHLIYVYPNYILEEVIKEIKSFL
jgi:hypothetical protein